jgi:hypothetical protein
MKIRLNICLPIGSFGLTARQSALLKKFFPTTMSIPGGKPIDLMTFSGYRRGGSPGGYFH